MDSDLDLEELLVGRESSKLKTLVFRDTQWDIRFYLGARMSSANMEHDAHTVVDICPYSIMTVP